jgi:hypothetical protein
MTACPSILTLLQVYQAADVIARRVSKYRYVIGHDPETMLMGHF